MQARHVFGLKILFNDHRYAQGFYRTDGSQETVRYRSDRLMTFFPVRTTEVDLRNIVPEG